jgi:hypothetical protein
MINFMNLRNIGEDNENTQVSHTYNTFNNIESNDSYNSYNLCIISSCVFIIYFLLTIPTLFMDIIIGFMYTCSPSQLNNLITINNWLITNGILYYVKLTILILLNRVYTEDTLFRKILKYTGYLITIFILMWSTLGIVIFFTYYYKTEKCQIFFYNYILIRIVLSPLIVILRFIEIYTSS